MKLNRRSFLTGCGAAATAALAAPALAALPPPEPIGPLPEWLSCDGRWLSVDDYFDLWNVIGSTYGYDRVSEHFRLPDLRGKYPYDYYIKVSGVDQNGMFKREQMPCTVEYRIKARRLRRNDWYEHSVGFVQAHITTRR